MDIFLLHLLIQDGQYSFPKDIFKAARELKLTESRVRNLYQEVQLRYQQLEEEQAKSALVELIEKGAFELKRKRFVFIVIENNRFPCYIDKNCCFNMLFKLG